MRSVAAMNGSFFALSPVHSSIRESVQLKGRKEEPAIFTCNNGFDEIRAESAKKTSYSADFHSEIGTGVSRPSFVERARDQVTERLGFDRALLLHLVQVDALPQLVLDRDRVTRESGQSKVCSVRRGKHLPTEKVLVIELRERSGRDEPTFSKLHATVSAWLPNRRSHAMATHSLPTMARQEPCRRDATTRKRSVHHQSTE